jgi:hypothetical protein
LNWGFQVTTRAFVALGVAVTATLFRGIVIATTVLASVYCITAMTVNAGAQFVVFLVVFPVVVTV